MSLLSSVEQVVKLYKAEQTKINDSVEVYRELLRSLTPQPKMSSEESELTEDAATDTDASPGEKEDIELLERALQKALRVRTGSEPSKKDSGGNKLSGARKEHSISSVTPVNATHSCAAAKGSQPTSMKSAFKSANLDRKRHKKLGLCSALNSRPSASSNPGQSKSTHNKNLIQSHPSSSAEAAHQQAFRKLQQAASASGSPPHMSASLSKSKTVGSSLLSGADLSRAASVSTPSSSNTEPCPHRSGAGGVLQQNGSPCEQAVKWKSLRSKQNRLWDKVTALQRKPVPGRSHFMERMRALFPTEWPSGRPNQTRALLDRLTHRGHELTLLSQEKEAQSRRTKETATESGGWEKEYDSCMVLERLQQTTAELQTSADQVKREWKAWDRWRPEGGCLCPTGASGVWGDGITAPLPLTVTYTTEAELQELEKLRMRVALLQQEIHLEQVLLDSLSPQLSSTAPGPKCLNPSVLRDMYSLLAEGGQRFPAIVLDSEPD
ncbi:uncharacterized protein C16orf59 homolog isoform X2 [Stegastes partitus]|uniref:Tubulin epsilon and delta complex 2 n=1 Tax=Stegastes partitus TaxID=144197 RepID=A0A3B5BFP6_9TELE|nr:PREDICTED: uncharacterized protein C16orf59 homolog isoform X2 [Stegastes partitus]